MIVATLCAAYAVTFLDLWSNGHRRVPEILVFNPAAHCLAGAYAVIALAMLALFDAVIGPSIKVAEGAEQQILGLFLSYLAATPLAKALFVGVFSNGLVNLKLFSVPTWQGQFPIGFQTLTQMFDPPLREMMADRTYRKLVRKCEDHIAATAWKSEPLAKFKRTAAASIPATYDQARKAIIRDEFDQATKPVDVLRAGVTRFGLGWLRDTFR